jgi:hypothetical protein
VPKPSVGINLTILCCPAATHHCKTTAGRELSINGAFQKPWCVLSNHTCYLCPGPLSLRCPLSSIFLSYLSPLPPHCLLLDGGFNHVFGAQHKLILLTRRQGPCFPARTPLTFASNVVSICSLFVVYLLSDCCLLSNLTTVFLVLMRRLHMRSLNIMPYVTSISMHSVFCVVVDCIPNRESLQGLLSCY